MSTVDGDVYIRRWVSRFWDFFLRMYGLKLVWKKERIRMFDLLV